MSARVCLIHLYRVDSHSVYILQDGTERWSSGHFGFLHTREKDYFWFSDSTLDDDVGVCLCVLLGGELRMRLCSGLNMHRCLSPADSGGADEGGKGRTCCCFYPKAGRQAPPHLLKSRHVNNKKHNFSQGGRSCHGNSVEWPSEAVDAILLGLDFVSHQQHSNSHVCSLEVWALLKWMIATTEEN